MEAPDLKNKWPSLRERILQEHPEWPAEELQYEEGQEEQLFLRLEKKRKANREEIYKWLHLMG